jgi:hypothetical protein
MSRVVAVTLGEGGTPSHLARLAFFASGHQATLSGIRWKSAFVLNPTARSPQLVILDTFGLTTSLIPRHHSSASGTSPHSQ